MFTIVVIDISILILMFVFNIFRVKKIKFIHFDSIVNTEILYRIFWHIQYRELQICVFNIFYRIGLIIITIYKIGHCFDILEHNLYIGFFLMYKQFQHFRIQGRGKKIVCGAEIPAKVVKEVMIEMYKL